MYNVILFILNQCQITEYVCVYIWTSLVAQTVKHLSTMQETRVRSLGWEDSPGEGNGNPLKDYCL